MVRFTQNSLTWMKEMPVCQLRPNCRGAPSTVEILFHRELYKQRIRAENMNITTTRGDELL